MKKLILFYILTLVITTSLSQECYWIDLSANVPCDTLSNLTDIAVIGDEIWITERNFTRSNYIYHSTDGGQTFELQNIETPLYCIQMISETIGYAGGHNARVYYTNNGGSTWNKKNGSAQAAVHGISFPPNSDTGYCCTSYSNGGHFIIIDSNSDWITLGPSPGTNAPLYGISFPNISEGWACGSSSFINHYKNGEWQNDQSYPYGAYNSIYFAPGTYQGWCVGDKILATSDGLNWSEQTNPASEYALTDVFFLDTLEGWIAGGHCTILHTIDGGNNWEIQSQGIKINLLRNIVFTSPTNGYAVGNNGTFLKFTDVLGIGNKSECIELDIFPNPIKDKIQIVCSDFKTQSGIIEILSLEGKEILKKQIGKGNENIVFDLHALQTGIYLCKITIDNRCSSKKIIIE